MKRIFSFGVLLLLGVILFLPKSNMYYSVEKVLASEHLYLNSEEINERFFYLDIDNAIVQLDTMPIATIEHISFFPLIAFNRVSIEGVAFSGEFESLFPQGIDHIDLTYTLLHPFTVKISGEGGFGPVQGEIDMKEKRLTLFFEASPIMRAYPLLLVKSRKSDEGLVYETSF